MNDDRFMILTSVLLGLLQMWGFFAFDMMNYLVEPICHSVRERCPECIVEYAGYYGSAAVCFSFTIGNLIAPCFLPLLGAKGCLILASIFFTIYAANFFYLVNFIFFPANLLCGFGFALFHAGGGSYSLRHSTDRTLSQNQSIQWMVAALTILLSAIFLIFTANFLNPEQIGNSTQIVDKKEPNYRNYSNTEIRVISTGISIFSLASIILAISLPKRELLGSLQKKIKNEITLKKQICKVLSAMGEKSLLKTSFLFCFTGSFFAVWQTIYPTTLSFTETMAKEKYLIAYHCIACFLGEVIVGLSITVLSKKIRDFGLVPAMVLSSILYLITASLMILFTPAESSLRPTKEISVFQPSIIVCVVLGMMNGLLDGMGNNARIVAATKAFPEEPAIAFSVSKFYQAGAQTIFLFLGSLLNLHQILFLVGVNLVIGIFCFISFLRDLQERKLSIDEKRLEQTF